MSDTDSRNARDLFLRAYTADLEAGECRQLEAYQAMFPGFEDDIAAEFALLEDEGATGDPLAGAASDDGIEQFGPYRLHEELGRGGQAVVFAAEDTRLGRRVALKVLRAGALWLGSEEDRRRFQREAQFSARLDHPAICSVFEAGEHEGTPFIAMRLVEGEPLQQRIASWRERAATRGGAAPSEGSTGRRADIDWLLGIGESCARALHFAHEQGVVHRDVKPGNVMITPSGEPVLLDFGLAHATSDDHSLTGSGTAMGTPYYMAPEQVRGDVREIDARTDVYSLGVTLYEAFTGLRPFEAPTREVLYRQVLLREPRGVRAIDSRLPRDLEVVLQTAMHKERDRRYRTAEALAEDLARVRRREPVLARPAGPFTRLWAWARRRPAVASLSALVLVIAVVGVVLLEENRAELGQKVAEFTRLADLRELRLLQERLKNLPAFLSEHHAELDRWVEEADALVGRLPLHEATSARLRAEEDLESNAIRWQLHALDDLIGEVVRFRDHELPLARGRRDHVAEVEEASLVAVESLWEEAIRSIAESGPASVYARLTLEPQIGLVPLGADSESGLHEFAHLASGAPAVRDASGRLAIGEDTGIVFVLLPGGPFQMGAVRPDDTHAIGSPNVDPWAVGPEGPVHDVTLAPFFISKYELTQGQWQRLTGENPSQMRPGDTEVGEQTGLAHPVDTVSHNRCRELFELYALSLPTEAQWEYAARAGTSSVWWCGDDPRELDRCGNLMDRTGIAATHRRVADDAIEAVLDDGVGFVAAVGRFAPNPFGLHDVIGNVVELVAGDPLYYSHPVRAGDGLRLEMDGGLANGQRQILRGGDWGSTPLDSRSATRRHSTPDTASVDIGVRPARRLDG